MKDEAIEKVLAEFNKHFFWQGKFYKIYSWQQKFQKPVEQACRAYARAEVVKVLDEIMKGEARIPTLSGVVRCVIAENIEAIRERYAEKKGDNV